MEHSREAVALVLKYKDKFPVDEEVLVPVAMMHDIGHSAILPEHFKHVTGPEKMQGGKLVHMLAGAKIARDILKKVGYDPKKSQEIIDIISIHDADQLEGVDMQKMYNSTNKKFFHDLDSLDRYNERRLASLRSLYPDRNELMKILDGLLRNFFFEDFRKIARENLGELQKQ